MNKSVPTLLGIVIILLVVVLVVLLFNYRVTQAIGRGERIVGTKGGELITGEEAPEEFIDETSALGGRADRPEPTTIHPEARTSERRQAAGERRGQRRAAGGTPESPGPP